MRARLPDGTIVEGTPEELAELLGDADSGADDWCGFYNSGDETGDALPDDFLDQVPRSSRN